MSAFKPFAPETDTPILLRAGMRCNFRAHPQMTLRDCRHQGIPKGRDMSVPLIEIVRATVGLSIQDMGRTGTTAIGLSQGGAMDKLALIEAAALLGQTHPSPAIEFMGVGGSLRVLCDMTVALTGGEMSAKVGDRLLQWNATHTLNAGDIIELSAPNQGFMAM